jgi:prepilin-type N-terminal cleavage/methylation domain-containing protein
MSNATRPNAGPAGRGFTLVELLAVLAIMALLCAMLMPALHRARSAAWQTVCQSRLRQWGVAFAAYAAENSGFYPHTDGRDRSGLASLREPNDTGALCWASDYLNVDRPNAELYLPAIQPGQRFRAVTGVLEQYTNLGDGFDYYQLLTLNTESLTELCPADLDQDGDVDLHDCHLFVEQLLLLASAAKAECYGAADLNQDGIVDPADLAAFNAAWQEADVNGDGAVNEYDLD